MIDTSMWKEFTVESLFDIKLPSARSEKNYSEGAVRYVSSGAFNNGVANYLEPKSDETLDKGHCITVSPLDGSSFWQDEDFMGRGGSGASISMLYNDNLNELNALYICSVIRNTASKFDYSDLLNSKNLKTLILRLPATPDGQPDWTYMESYMKSIMEESEKSLENLKKADDTKHLIDTSAWGEFRVGDLFKMSLSKDDIQPKSIIEGEIPLISSGKTNNGIVAYIQDGNASIQKANTITVDMFGKAFYQANPYYCVSHGRVNILTPSFDMNEYTGIFIASAIEKVSNEKYEFDSMCTGTKLAEDVIYLPITSAGKPDWQYMEDYMKQIMKKAELSLNSFRTKI